MSNIKLPPYSFTNFGEFLKFLRRRAQLSQRELSIAVGYSESQISRLESNERPPDPPTILALFAPALGIQDEQELLDRLVELSRNSHSTKSNPVTGQTIEEESTAAVQRLPAQASPASAFPTGIVSFLFSDIEGSTPLWESQPEAMRASVAQHHAILRNAIEAHAGKVFQILGDAFQAAFIEPRQSLQAAIQAQRDLRDASWGATGPLRVRMGLHTGEAELASSGMEYAVTHTLNRASRVMSAGHGGQILLSEETANLLKRSLPGETRLKDLGEHRLRGMEKLEHIFQVVAPGLPEHFPPLTSQQALRNHLPVQLTSFVGRQEELAELCDLLRSGRTRLLTLTGEGGCGKTRLALRAGEELAQEYEHGAWLVELAPLDDPQLVVKTTAAVFGLRDAGPDTFRELVDFLENKKILVILDNCEHLVEEAARLAEALLRQCPGLQLMATTRETLEVPGEMVFRALPLALPPARPDLQVVAEEIECYDAIQLFIERAHNVQRMFGLNDENAAAVARICQQLDGIPLAIELAAARVNILSPTQIASRLEADLELLSSNRRFGPRQQQTLKATIDWSYNLLSEAERVLLRRLSVFHGGWTMEAAEEIAGVEPISSRQVVELLSGLANKSLVHVITDVDGTNRYSLLETVRICLREKLMDSGEHLMLRDHHLDFYVNLAEAAEPHLICQDQASWMVRLEQENDNLRSALAWSLEQKRVEAGLRMAGALWRYWWMSGSAVEGSRWCQAVLKMADGNSRLKESRLRSAALMALGFLLEFTAQDDKAIPALEESVRIYKSLDDAAGSGAALCLLGITYMDTNPEYAAAFYEEGLQYSYQAEDGWWIAFNKH